MNLLSSYSRSLSLSHMCSHAHRHTVILLSLSLFPTKKNWFLTTAGAVWGGREQKDDRNCEFWCYSQRSGKANVCLKEHSIVDYKLVEKEKKEIFSSKQLCKIGEGNFTFVCKQTFLKLTHACSFSPFSVQKCIPEVLMWRVIQWSFAEEGLRNFLGKDFRFTKFSNCCPPLTVTLCDLSMIVLFFFFLMPPRSKRRLATDCLRFTP